MRQANMAGAYLDGAMMPGPEAAKLLFQDVMRLNDNRDAPQIENQKDREIGR